MIYRTIVQRYVKGPPYCLHCQPPGNQLPDNLFINNCYFIVIPDRVLKPCGFPGLSAFTGASRGTCIAGKFTVFETYVFYT